MSFERGDAVGALFGQERHVELHELAERRDHLLHHRQRFARGGLDLGELARHAVELVLLRLHLRRELVVVLS